MKFFRITPRSQQKDTLLFWEKQRKKKNNKSKSRDVPEPSFMQWQRLKRRAVWAHWSEAKQTYCFNLGWRSLCAIPRG